MYHIKPDKRSKTSAVMLYDALIACLKDKPFDKISITDIVTRATTSRSTFYRNFDEKTDILCWKCDQRFEEVLRGYVAEGCKNDLGLLEYIFGYWQNHAEVLEILLNIRRIDIIYDSFFRKSPIVTDFLRQHMALPKEQESYFTSIRMGVFIGVIQAWIQGGKKETAHELSIMLGEQFQQVATGGLIF